jgi:hypothetical protein
MARANTMVKIVAARLKSIASSVRNIVIVLEQVAESTPLRGHESTYSMMNGERP